MKKRIWACAVGGLAVALGYGYYRYFVPKIGHASATEIDSVLPDVLKEQDSPDPEGEARYEQIRELAEKRNPQGGVEAPLRELEKVLAEGAIRFPYREPNANPSWIELKDLAKGISLAAREAGKRGDKAQCARWTELGIRYGSAMRNGGGIVIEALMATAFESMALRTAYVAEISGWLDEPGRERVLALIPATDGRSTAWAGDVRRDFQRYLLLQIQNPRAREEEIMANVEYVDPEKPDQPKPTFYGNIDPIETARLAGRIYSAFIADLNHPAYEGGHGEERIYAEMEKEMVHQPEGEGDGEPSPWAMFRYRMAMNASPNSLGKYLAVTGITGGLRGTVVRDAAHRNLIRAVFLLRMGKPVEAIDPYNGKPLLVDRKRQIVWSVGSNLKDDGGLIGRGGENMTEDIGYPYGDDSYHPNPNGPFRAEPPGMPPKP